MAVTIVVAKSVSDLSKLQLMFDNVFQTKPTHVPERGDLATFADHRDTCVLLAVREDEIVGGLVAYELQLLSGTKEFYLYDIAVLPGYRKQGIGTLLIAELKNQARARGVSIIFVEAESKDTDAADFYQSLQGEHITVDHFNIAVD